MNKWLQATCFRQPEGATLSPLSPMRPPAQFCISAPGPTVRLAEQLEYAAPEPRWTPVTSAVAPAPPRSPARAPPTSPVLPVRSEWGPAAWTSPTNGQGSWRQGGTDENAPAPKHTSGQPQASQAFGQSAAKAVHAVQSEFSPSGATPLGVIDSNAFGSLMERTAVQPVSLLLTPSATELPTTTPGVPVRTASTPLTALLPRGARLLRMGATGRDSSHPSPPKVPSPACTRTLAALLADEDVQEWAPFAAGTCVIAILVALLLHYYGRTALVAPVGQRAPFVATATLSALALYDPRMSYSVGHTLYLPSLLRFPELCQSHWDSDSSLPALTSWFFRSCGAPVVARLTALPAGGPTLRLDGAALAAAAQRTAVALFHAVQPQQQQPGASLAGAACAALALGVFAARRQRGGRAQPQPQDTREEGVTTPATFASGFMHEERVEHEREEHEEHMCADSDEREEHEHLVATPAVTRLLSFSRVSSPVELRASIGTAVVRAAPSSALRRSARVASKRKSVMGTRAATRQAAGAAR